MMINKWKNLFGEFPGSTMVRTLLFHFREHEFDPSLIWELSSWQAWGIKKKKKKLLYLLMSMAFFLATFKLLLLTVTSKIPE